MSMENTKMASLSVIIPVYHVENYIERCLTSVLEQTDADVDMECIIVDDCSSDGSMEIVRRVISQYQGTATFLLLRHEHNRGLSAARNTGMEHATGDYLLFVDSDDYLPPHSLHILTSQLKVYPSVDVVMGNTLNKKDNQPIYRLNQPRLIDNRETLFFGMVNCQINLYAWNKLIRRDLIASLSMKFVEGNIYEDIWWSYQLFNSISSLLMLPQTTYVYEYNPQSIVNAQLTQERVDRIVYSYVYTCRHILNSPPQTARFVRNPMPDFLLYVANIMFRAVSCRLKSAPSPEVDCSLRDVRSRLVCSTFRCGRILILCFLLLLYPPFSKITSLRSFQGHYFFIERILSHLSHATDFLHRK